MSPAVLAVAVLLASVVPHDRAAAKSSVNVPPTKDGRLDFVCSSADENDSILYSAQDVDSDHISDGYYTVYKSKQPLSAQQEIAFSYEKPAEFGVTVCANNTDGESATGNFSIRSAENFGGGPGPVENPVQIKFVFSPATGGHVTLTPGEGLTPYCVFGQSRSAGEVSIRCGGN